MPLTDFLKPVSNSINVGGKGIKSLEELYEQLEKIDDNAFESVRDKIHPWIRNEIGDKKTARQILKLKYRKNYVKLFSDRVQQIKDIADGILPTEIQINIKLYVNNVRLVLDLEKCVRCDVAHNVCPKEAVELIGKGPFCTVSVDPEKCVLCGLCVPFCTAGALEIHIDEKEEVLLENYESIPILPGLETINNSDTQVKRLFSGYVTINESKCPEDCEDCVIACPINALEREGKRVLIDRVACTICGACMNACPEDAITLSRNRLLYKEEKGFSAIWTECINTLLGKGKVNVAENAKSMTKIIGMIGDAEMEKYKKPLHHKMT
ncbi:MAG: 4Fe-4S binding protein [Promethearchaeota archaeon]